MSISPLSSGPHESAQQNSSTETSTGESLLQRALKKESLRENPEEPAEDGQAATASQGAAHEKRRLLLPEPHTGQIILL